MTSLASPSSTILRALIASAYLLPVLLVAAASSAPAREKQPTDRIGAGFSVLVKPIVGDAGTVVALEVTEGITALSMPDRGPLVLTAPLSTFGVRRLASRIEGLSARDDSGSINFTTSDPPPTGSGDDPRRRWTATRPIAGTAVLTYRIGTQPIAENGPPYGMKAAGRGVAGSGRGFLVLPENSGSRSTRMSWDLSELPAGSIGVVTAGEGDATVPGPPEEMVTQWMLAGPARKFEPDRGGGFHAYLLGSPAFDAQEEFAWASRAYQLLARRLRYLGSPTYRLLFRVLEGPSFATGTARSAGGGALITSGTEFLAGQQMSGLRNTIFHEMTHQWVGDFASDAPWFAEGLTTYLAAKLPCEAGMATPAECALSINEFAGYYYNSRARNWSLERIGATTGDESIRRVPYGRGMLYFANLDAELRRDSRGARGLEDLLIPLFAARSRGEVLTDASWRKAIRAELGQKAVSEFGDFVVRGTRTIIPPQDAFGPCLDRVRAAGAKVATGEAVEGYVWTPTHSVKPCGRDRKLRSPSRNKASGTVQR